MFANLISRLSGRSKTSTSKPRRAAPPDPRVARRTGRALNLYGRLGPQHPRGRVLDGQRQLGQWDVGRRLR